MVFLTGIMEVGNNFDFLLRAKHSARFAFKSQSCRSEFQHVGL